MQYPNISPVIAPANVPANAYSIFEVALIVGFVIGLTRYTTVGPAASPTNKYINGTHHRREIKIADIIGNAMHVTGSAYNPLAITGASSKKGARGRAISIDHSQTVIAGGIVANPR